MSDDRKNRPAPETSRENEMHHTSPENATHLPPAAGEDEFDALFARFSTASASATRQPDAARRTADLALAAKNFADLQGARDEARLNVMPPQSGLWQGMRKMFQRISTRGALTLTTAVVAGGVLVLSPQGRDLLAPPAPQLAQEAPATRSLAAPQGQNAATAQDEMATAQDAMPAQTAGTPAQIPPVAAQEAPPPPPVTAQVTATESAPLSDMATAGQGAASSRLAEAPAMAEMAQATAGDAMPAIPAPLPNILTRAAPMPQDLLLPSPQGETYANAPDAGVTITAESPVSTFAVDVDTASWSLLRQGLNMGQILPPEALRLEEMINYFPYDYAGPAPDDPAPFAAHLALIPTPWNPDTQILRIGLQGEMAATDPRPALNLVFLIDTSGSMEDPAKLPLLQAAFRLLVGQLGPADDVAIVTYAGSAGVVLPPTPASERGTILKAIDQLGAGGGTAGAAGLVEAYALADGMRAEGEVSRVILATDGDFNIGPSDPEALTRLVSEARAGGSYLSVLGFGRGNLDDAVMQSLAQNGNGTAAYIDTLGEAQKVLGAQVAGAFFPIADDVKVQVEFNPATVAEYRLIGYETRALDRQDFNNDRVDAGEIGAGHAVTALYEITPVGSPATLADPLRYGTQTASGPSDELGFLRLRWKEPGESESQLWDMPIPTDLTTELSAQSDAAFAAAIAGFGQILKGGDFTGDWQIKDAIALASDHLGDDPFGYRQEALRLMQLAEALRPEP